MNWDLGVEGNQQPLSSDLGRTLGRALGIRDLMASEDRCYCYLCSREKKTGLEVDTGRQGGGQARLQAYLTPIPVLFLAGS